MQPKVVWRWERAPKAKPSRAWQLSDAEQANVKDAIRLLRRHMGRRRFATAIGISYPATRQLTETKRRIGASLALRVSRAAGVSVETILAGVWLGPEPCPTCGR
jgi:hypothetical protein